MEIEVFLTELSKSRSFYESSFVVDVSRDVETFTRLWLNQNDDSDDALNWNGKVLLDHMFVPGSIPFY